MEKNHAKSRQLNVMPNVIGLNPALHDFSINRKETSNNLHLNLLNVKKADSIGLSILLGLIFLGKDQLEKYNIKITPSRFDSVNLIFDGLGLYKLINTIRGTGNRESTLDLIDYLQRSETDRISTYKLDGLQKIILFNPKLHPLNRQEAINSFSSSLKEFMACNTPRSFNHEQIIKTLIELAKNTYDHSDGIGFTGLKINDKHKLIQVVYCDTGEGICINVRRYLKEMLDTGLNPEKAGVTDVLHKAFEAGFSTKYGNGINHGMGLPLVIYGAKGCGFDLIFRDADSLINLSAMKDLTRFSHKRLREVSYKTTMEKLLMFYFEREI